MALTECPECGRKVPDVARSCPHCGCPLAEDQAPSSRVRRAQQDAGPPNSALPPTVGKAGVAPPPKQARTDRPISFACPSCDKGLKVPADKAGKTGKCPYCQTPISIPTVGQAEKGTPAGRARADRSLTHSGWFTAAWVISVLLAMLVFGYAFYRHLDRSAAEKSADLHLRQAKSALSREEYADARSAAESARFILGQAGVDSGSVRAQVEDILGHLDRGEVLYEGQWVSREEKAMRLRGYVMYQGKWVTAEDHARLSQGLVKYGEEWVTPEDREKLEQGLVKYQDQWVTPHEKDMLSRGYVKYEDQWVTRQDKEMLSRGLVKYQGRWVTPADKQKLEQGYVQYQGEWVTKEEWLKRGKGMVEYEGKLVTPQERATVVCFRAVQGIGKNLDDFNAARPDDPAQFFTRAEKEMADAITKCDRIGLQAVDPDLAVYCREYRAWLVGQRALLKELNADTEAARERVADAKAGGAFAGGLAAGAEAETAGEALVGGLLLGALVGAAAGNEATEEEAARLQRKWEPKFEEEARKADALTARWAEVEKKMRARYQLLRERIHTWE